MKKINLLIIAIVGAQLACSSAGNQTTANVASPANNTAAVNTVQSNIKAETNTVSNKETTNSAPKSVNSATAETRSKIVKFEKGATSAVYEEELPKDGIYKFTINAKKDQIIAIRTGTDSGEVVFDVSHNGKTIPSSVDTSKWTDKLPADGDYIVTATRKSGKGKFKIEFVVENES